MISTGVIPVSNKSPNGYITYKDVRDSIVWIRPYIPYILTVLASLMIAAMSVMIWCCLRRRRPSLHKEVRSVAVSDITQTKAGLPSPSLTTSSYALQQICVLPSAVPTIGIGATVQPDTFVFVHDTDHARHHAGDVHYTEDGWREGVRGEMNAEENSRPGVAQLRAFGNKPVPYCSLSGYASPIRDVGGSDTPSSIGSPIHTPPLRMRAKGLLERRGSNSSLTLDLRSTSASDSPTISSPPRESTTEEFLMSASNRLTSHDLREVIKKPNAIYDEFWEIPMNHPDKLIVPGSAVKNRYRTIIPNEASRVKLRQFDFDPLTCYINANYITGYAGEPRAFIATQGPMANTVVDFWRMIWQEQSQIIVMITKLTERNRTKCECYLPERDGTFGDVRVQVNDISERDSYITRHLTLTRNNRTHTVTHYWYTAWPDHKTPDASRQLLELVAEVDQLRRNPATCRLNAPVTVHCSAGIGRTGCFIAMCIGVQQLMRDNYVDLLSIVCNMRLNRGGMVQTNEQYEYIHRVMNLFDQEFRNHEHKDARIMRYESPEMSRNIPQESHEYSMKGRFFD